LGPSGAWQVLGKTTIDSQVSLRAGPLPVGDHVSIRLSGADDEVTISIVDLRGRTVRTLSPRRFGSGWVAEWDRTDRRGARVAPGMYLVVARGPRVHASLKVTAVD
jgi:hypothetical protein